MEESWPSYQTGTDFNVIAQSIGTNIQKISQNALSLKKMVKIIGTPQDTNEQNTQRCQIRKYTQELIHDTSLSLKELNAIPKPKSAESREYKLRIDTLVEEFANALRSFQETQRLAYEKEAQLKDALTRDHISLPAPPSKQKSHRKQMDSNNQLIELEEPISTQTQAQLLEEEREIQQIEQQEAAINRLENDIKNVNEIFTKLGELVHNQGEIVDSIEANIESTKVSVSDGANHLRESVKLKNKLLKRKCLLLGLPITVVLICFIILIAWSNNK